jgi:hypothetical protein
MEVSIEARIAAERAASLAQIVAKVNGVDVTRGELDEVFKLVQPKDNWKMPIDAVVPRGTKLAMLKEAVIFFTGSSPTIKQVRGGFRVTAAGYYAAVGA